jgi:type VI secretion system secreted protein VgrG
VKNWVTGIANRISTIDKGKVMNAYDFRGSTRDVTQTWQTHPGDPQYCPVDGPAEGDTREIDQRFDEHPDPWAVGGKSWHWSPPVPSPTWD